jgi:peroxin-11C
LCRGPKDQEYHKKLQELGSAEFRLYLDVIKNAADLVMCINWMPPGFLWAGKMSPARNAVFGTLSSVIGLSMMVKDTNQKLREQKAKSS